MEQQDGAGGVATVAKEQAGQVGQTAAQAGGQVAQTTKDQAAKVVGEAKQQARDLVGEARTQVGDQAGAQKGRAVEGLRSLADELHQLAPQAGQSGIATEVARQAASRAHGLADHLDRHDPGELLDQVRSYARRRPVAFLAGAAVLGVLAGRLTRNLASDDPGPASPGPAALSGGSPAPALPASTTVETYGSGFRAPGYEPTTAVPAAPGAGFETVGADPAGYEQGGEPGRYEPGYQPDPGSQPGSTHQPLPDYAAPGYQPTQRHQTAPSYGTGAGYDPVPGQPTPGSYESTEGTGPDDERWRTP